MYEAACPDDWLLVCVEASERACVGVRELACMRVRVRTRTCVRLRMIAREFKAGVACLVALTSTGH